MMKSFGISPFERYLMGNPEIPSNGIVNTAYNRRNIMNGKLKTMTLAIVAMFCITAVVCVVGDTDTSADDTIDRFLYFEIVNEDGVVVETDWIKFTSTTDPFDFAEKATAAFALYGHPDIGFTVSGEFITIDFEGATTPAPYVGSDDGKSWVFVNDTSKQYQPAKYIALELDNAYLTEETYEKVADKDAWKKTGTGDPEAYVKIPAEMPTDAASHEFPKEYTSHVFVEVIGDDGRDVSTQWVEFKAVKTLKSFIYNANKAFVDCGLSKLEFTSTAWIIYDGSISNASYYADGKKWVEVGADTNVYLSDSIALAVGNGYISTDVYNALSDSEKGSWKSTGSSGTAWDYMKIVEESTSGYESQNGVAVYIAVGMLLVIVIGTILAFRKRM